MELGKAKVCTDCSNIYEGEACPHCGSAVYWWMSKMVHVVREGGKEVGPHIRSREHPHGRERMVISREKTTCFGAEVMQGQ
jgi:hypothetical protein